MPAPAFVGGVDFHSQGLATFPPDQLQKGVNLGLGAVIVLLGGRGSDVKEIGQTYDLPKKLQELQPPVLEGVAPIITR